MRRSCIRLAAAGLPPLTQPCSIQPANADTVIQHLKKFPPVDVSQLSNGFQVATCNQGGETATVGIWIDAGSRFETGANNGVAHFLEHLTFKGTTSRTKSQIENFFETVGGHLNAYTTRENTIYYVKVFKKHLPEAFDVLTDILRRPRLSVFDIERERGVIMQEMKEVEKNIDEVIMDHIHLSGFKDQGLGLTILGPAENINMTIDKPMIQQYIDTHYTAPRMRLIACGAVDHAEMESLGQQFWGDLSQDPPKPEVNAVFTPGEHVHRHLEIPSPHVAIAWPVCAQSEADFLSCQVLQNIIGTWDRHSHSLESAPNILQFHEKYCAGSSGLGTLESVQAFTTPYSDTGLFGLYLIATPHEDRPNRFAELTQLALQMLVRAVANVDAAAVARAKAQLKASSLLVLDGSTALADELGKQMLTLNRWMPLEELFARIDAIEKSDIDGIFEKYVNQKPFVLGASGDPAFMPTTADVGRAIWAA